MNINIKKNDKPNLKKCEFDCDKPLHPKLEKYELTKHFNKHQCCLIIGKPGSGKTSFLYSLLKGPLCKVYHNIIVFQPSASRYSMKDKIFDNLPPENLFEELNEENLLTVKHRIENEDKDLLNMILIDDMAAYLNDYQNAKILKEIIFNRRHIRCSLFIVAQTYISIPREIRRISNNIILYDTSIDEFNKMWDEQIRINKKENIEKLMRLCFDEKYNFLFINVSDQKFFKNWDELIFDNL